MNLGDYVDVPTRFRLALDKWPAMLAHNALHDHETQTVPTDFRGVIG